MTHCCYDFRTRLSQRHLFRAANHTRLGKVVVPFSQFSIVSAVVSSSTQCSVFMDLCTRAGVGYDVLWVCQCSPNNQSGLSLQMSKYWGAPLPSLEFYLGFLLLAMCEYLSSSLSKECGKSSAFPGWLPNQTHPAQGLGVV